MAAFFNQATLSYGSTTVNSNVTTGEWVIDPGTAVITVTGTV